MLDERIFLIIFSYEKVYNLYFNSDTYLSAKISFSVIPSNDVPQAKTNIKIPNDVWIGMYDDLRWDASPGKRKVMNPPSHYNVLNL